MGVVNNYPERQGVHLHLVSEGRDSRRSLVHKFGRNKDVDTGSLSSDNADFAAQFTVLLTDN